MNVFVPMWHPPEGGYAGGFLRARKFVETQKTFDLIVFDTDTTDIDDALVNGRLHRMKLSWAFARRGIAFSVVRAYNWMLTAFGATLVGLTSREKLDLVYVPYSELLSVALAGLIVGRMRRVPVVFCNLNVRGVPLWPLNRMLHKRCDRIITISHALRNELAAEGIEVPIDLGTVGVDDGSVARSAVQYDGIFVGRHTEEKGIFDLIAVWEICCRTNPSSRIALVGPCTDDIRSRLEALIQEKGLDRNVDILGPVSEQRKWELYASSRLAVFPSHVEGWGIVPIEAHLAGLPAVAYDLPAYEETIRHSPAALLVPEGAIDDMARAVLEALALPAERVEAARRWAQQFTWEKAVNREVELISNVLDRQRTTT